MIIPRSGKPTRGKRRETKKLGELNAKICTSYNLILELLHTHRYDCPDWSAIPHKGVNNELRDKGVNNELRDKGVNNKLRDKGVNNKLRDKGVNNELRDKGVNNKLRDKGVNNELRNKGVNNELREIDERARSKSEC